MCREGNMDSSSSHWTVYESLEILRNVLNDTETEDISCGWIYFFFWYIAEGKNFLAYFFWPSEAVIWVDNLTYTHDWCPFAPFYFDPAAGQKEHLSADNPNILIQYIADATLVGLHQDSIKILRMARRL